MKQCRECAETKPLSDFYRRSALCKPCDSVRHKEYYVANRAAKLATAAAYRDQNRDQLREWQRQYRHGTSVSEGACAICGCTGPRVVDHDHGCCPSVKSCEKCRRGLLCNNCNAALGLFEDNPDLLEAAAAYLRQPPGISPADKLKEKR